MQWWLLDWGRGYRWDSQLKMLPKVLYSVLDLGFGSGRLVEMVLCSGSRAEPVTVMVRSGWVSTADAQFAWPEVTLRGRAEASSTSTKSERKPCLMNASNLDSCVEHACLGVPDAECCSRAGVPLSNVQGLLELTGVASPDGLARWPSTGVYFRSHLGPRAVINDDACVACTHTLVVDSW
jgi:hypothetical protein